MLTRSFAVAALLAAWAIAFVSESQAQFETRAAFPITNEAPYSVVMGDFNRDGILDLAELNFLPTGSVEILLGNGDGTFRPGDTYAVAGAPFYAASASLRRDGILDLVIAGGGVDDVYVLLGNGDGTFQAPVPYATTAGPKMLALGDFTDGGSIDVVVLEGTSTEGIICDCIEVLPGNGDGTFGAPISTTPVPYNVTGFAIVAGDFNDDGQLVVAVSGGYFSAYQVDILLGNGDGTFTADGYYPVVADPDSIAVGYFTSDKTRLDLAVAGSVGSSVSVLLGNGDGTFQQSVYYPTSFPTWVIAQDLDGDGNIDLATSNVGVPEFTKQYPPGVSVLKGNGDGTFEPGVFYRSGNKSGVNYVAAGDFNRDHRPDLALVGVSGQIITLLNTGAVTFSPTTPLGFGTQAAGTTSTARTVTLTNTGTKPLEILSIKASSDFVVKSSCAARVAPGANCTISAWFSPAKQGTKRGAIEIIDGASSKPQVIELFGTGT